VRGRISEASIYNKQLENQEGYRVNPQTYTKSVQISHLASMILLPISPDKRATSHSASTISGL
jgi:hypothetical protein